MKRKIIPHLITIGVVIMLFILGLSCITVTPNIQLTPNASQSVVRVKRSFSDTEKKTQMEVYIDGRPEPLQVANGVQGQYQVMNGLHNIFVKIGKKHQSQMLTFDGQSEVVEFFVNFEGSGRNARLNLIKTAGGDGKKEAASNSPTIILNVDNSSSNTSSSSGNSSSSSVNVGDDNSVR